MKYAFALLLFAAGAASADYSTHPKTPGLLNDLRLNYGFSAPELMEVKNALAQAQRLEQLIPAEQHNKEKTLSWDAYGPLHLTAANIANGRRVLREQAHWLALAEQQYGVAPAAIVALIGVETKYGTYTGKYRVLDALATQGYEHPTRAEFFFDQLTQFFVLCRDAGFDPQLPRGSYAGAMGDSQFMPGPYRSLAVDFDGDGRRDLWSLPDAIGSVANYLAHFDAARAWRRGEPLAVRARLTRELPADFPRNGKFAAQTVGELRAAGIEPSAALPDDMPAGLVLLDRRSGPEPWVALPNFYSIESYNPRIYYAMAVTQLAAQIMRAEP
jgi:membrane-bound lytic murein transglycosylase B